MKSGLVPIPQPALASLLPSAGRFGSTTAMPKVSKSVLSGNESSILIYIFVRFWAALKLSTLTTPGIYQFDAELREVGRSLAMRRKILTSLKTMVTFAQSRGLVAQNVARSVKVNGDRRTKQGPLREGVDFPSRSELRAIIDTAPARWRPLLVTAIFSAGVRPANSGASAGRISTLRQASSMFGNARMRG